MCGGGPVIRRKQISSGVSDTGAWQPCAVRVQMSFLIFLLYMSCHLPFISVSTAYLSVVHHTSFPSHGVNITSGWLCWLTPIVSALGRLRQEHLQFEARLGFIARLCLRQFLLLFSPIPSVLLPASPFSNFTTLPLHCQAVVHSCLQKTLPGKPNTINLSPSVPSPFVIIISQHKSLFS